MVIKLPVRYLSMQSTGPDDNLERNIVRTKAEYALDTDETALILVDVWGGHHLKSHQERTARIMKEKILPVLAMARRSGLTVVYAPSPPVARNYPQWVRYAGDEELAEESRRPKLEAAAWPPQAFKDRTGSYAAYDRQPAERPIDYDGPYPDWWHIRDIASVIEPGPDDFVVATGAQLQRLLSDRRILHLLYVGFATNICVLYRDYGIRAMKERGYLTVVLRDCTTAIETRESWDQLWTTKWTIQEIERFHFTALSGDFISACS